MTAQPPLTALNKVGLVLAAVLALADLGLPRAGLLIGLDLPDPEDEANLALIWGTLVVSVALALTTIIAVVQTWRAANRIGARIVAATRIVSMLLVVPVFFAAGLTESGRVFAVLPIMPVAAAHVLVTILAVGLVLFRRPPGPSFP